MNSSILESFFCVSYLAYSKRNVADFNIINSNVDKIFNLVSFGKYNVFSLM